MAQRYWKIAFRRKSVLNQNQGEAIGKLTRKQIMSLRKKLKQ